MGPSLLSDTEGEPSILIYAFSLQLMNFYAQFIVACTERHTVFIGNEAVARCSERREFIYPPQHSSPVGINVNTCICIAAVLSWMQSTRYPRMTGTFRIILAATVTTLATWFELTLAQSFILMVIIHNMNDMQNIVNPYASLANMTKLAVLNVGDDHRTY